MKLIDRLKRASIAACLGLPVIATFAADRMERDFKAPPKSVKTAVYWYWIEGNITKEGVIKDLEAMKKAGINRAFIANIGGTGTGDPNALHKVEFMSDEWWDITHAALKRASELDIEIGVFNSPGWSQHDSDAFLWDLRRFVSDRISYEHVAGMRDVANRHGLTTWLENYGHWGFPGEFLQYGGQADEVGGEFWVDPPYGEIENRLATSCAHIYGTRLTSSESS